MIKLEDFDIDNILTDKKSHENILIYDILDKIVINPKHFCIICDQIDGFIRIYDETTLTQKNMKLFITESVILQPKKWHHLYFFSLFCKNRS